MAIDPAVATQGSLHGPGSGLAWSGPAQRPAREAPLIELRDVTVRFRDVRALDAVTLDVRTGERVALLGSNGSGKTTLLRVLHGLQRCHGERVLNASVRQAMVFQRPFLLRLSVWANMMIALWLAKVPTGERAHRAHAALHRVGLAELRGRPARVLSLGQQQRLALARAWAVRPRLLFLDEPTASLDPGAKREVEALIEEFAAEGMTVVMSTHNLGQAKRLATRVVYLEGGRLIVDLPTDRFFNDQLPEEAALFLKGELHWT
jgi:tungstate transport system ATP-binding protein